MMVDCLLRTRPLGPCELPFRIVHRGEGTAGSAREEGRNAKERWEIEGLGTQFSSAGRLNNVQTRHSGLMRRLAVACMRAVQQGRPGHL